MYQTVIDRMKQQIEQEMQLRFDSEFPEVKNKLVEPISHHFGRDASSDRNIAIVFRRGDHLADTHRLGATHPADRWIRLGTIFQSRTCGLEKPCDPMLLR